MSPFESMENKLASVPLSAYVPASPSPVAALSKLLNKPRPMDTADDSCASSVIDAVEVLESLPVSVTLKLLTITSEPTIDPPSLS